MNANAEAAIVVPLKDTPKQLDPQKIESIYEMIVNLQIHRGLMRFLPNLSIAPDIAGSYDVLDGGKRVRFHLTDRSFSNGEKITASHVVRTFQRMFVLRSGIAADMDYIENARAILGADKSKANLTVLGVHEIDEKTVEFKLIKPVAMFLAHLATVDAAILPLKDDLRYDWQKMGGAGPYRLKSLNDKAVEIERVNALDATKSLSPTLVRFESLSTDDAIKAALEGRVDTLDGYSVPNATIDSLKKRSWQESVSTITRQLFLVQNPSRVKQAIRDAIAAAVMNQREGLLPAPYIKAFGLIPTSMSGALNAHEIASPHVARLAKPEKITLTIVDGEPSLIELSKNLASLLKPLNVEINMASIPLKDYMTTVNQKTYDIIVRSKFLDYPDGLSILTYFRSHYSANTFFIDDAVVDQLLEQSFVELDKAKRIHLYEKIQTKILSHHIVVPVVFGSDNRGLWGAKIKTVPSHPLGLQGLPFETLEIR